jgi:hypothetical protein
MCVRCGNVPAVLEVIIDNNAIDPLVDIPGAYEAARDSIQRGDLRISYVYTTLNEAAATPDLDRRTRKLLVLIGAGNLVPASGVLFNEFRFDQTAYSDDAGAAALDALASGDLNNENHRRDALAAETAHVNGWALLTNEKRRLRNRATELGIEVLSTDELFAEIGFAPAAATTTTS